MNNNSLVDNSNKSEDDNEILFWKVIHNRFLFRKILHTIENVEWVECTHPFKTSNRIKFKYIYSLEWMVKHNQFQLLKYKLLNDQEYVEINNNGIKSLLSLNFSDSGESNNNNNNKTESSTTSTPSTLDIELFKDILQHVIKRLKLQSSLIPISTLISTAFKCSNLQVINQIFKCLNDGTTLESTIINTYKMEYKNQFNIIFNSVVSNKNHKLLNTILDIIQQQQQQPPPNSGKEFISKLKITEFIGINNTEIQNRLLDLDLLKVGNKLDPLIVELLQKNINDDNNTDTTLISLRIIYKLYKKESQLFEYQRQEMDNTLIIKESLKLFTILSQSTELFKIYLSKYNQPITELSLYHEFNFIGQDYCFKYFILDISNQSIYGNGGYKRKDKPFVSSNLSRSIEFLKLYLSKLSTISENLQPKEVTLDIIYDIVFEIQDPIQYEQLVNNVIPEYYQKFLPLKWNSIINLLNFRKDFTIVVKDTETIDWMKEWFIKRLESNIPLLERDTLYTSFDGYIINILNFKTIELSTYASNQLSFLKLNNKSTFYSLIFFKAIINSDFQTIKSIHSLGITFSNFYIDNSFNEILMNGECNSITIVNYQELNQIIGYIIEHQMISDHSVYHLFCFIGKHGYYNDSKYNEDNCKGLIQYDLDQVKLDLGSYLQQHNFEFEEVVNLCNNYNQFRFLLENIKFTNQDPESVGDVGDVINIENDQDKSNYIKSLIQLVINQLKQCREIVYLSSNGNSDDETANLQFYNTTLNSLFNSFALGNDDFEQFKQVYQMCIDNQVELEIDNNIRLGYIRSRFPILFNYLCYQIVYQVQPFELFTKSFDQMVELLFYRPYIGPKGIVTFGGNSNFKVCISNNLMFLLQIKRIDLFLKEWELIKSEFGIRVLFHNKTFIGSCCINLELNSINDILEFIESTIESRPANLKLLYRFCKISLKLGALEISKLVYSYLIKLSNQYKHSKEHNNLPCFKFLQSIQHHHLDTDNYILSNRFSLIKILNK